MVTLCILLLVAVGPVWAQKSVIPLVDWEISNSQIPNTWYKIEGAITVLAGLEQNGIYEELYYGLNLQNVSRSQFTVPWNYRTDFILDPSDQGKTIIVVFKGINYRADVFFNSAQLGSQENIVGTFRYFEFDLTSRSKFGGAMNTLELLIYPSLKNEVDDPASTDLAMTFVDWTPPPPDYNMGLWREAELHILDGPVSVSYPVVTTSFDSSTLTTARLTVMAELHNWGSATVTGVLSGSILGFNSTFNFNQSVSLPSGQISQVTFLPANYPALVINNPRVWWPWQMGTPNLYNLTLTFTINGIVSDSLNQRFGIRTITDLLDDNHRLYQVNGKNILIRGAGYSPDLLLRSEIDSDWQEKVLQLTRDLDLNTIRFEGKFPTDYVFDGADEMGLLVIVGWCCCDAWENWNAWGPEQHLVSQESARSQAKRLRIHASVISFWYSSDLLPPVVVENQYLNVFNAEKWPTTLLASAGSYISPITGRTGVKMSGPYSWVAPNYWLTDPGQVGGAWGFLTEGGPGEAPLSLEMMQVTIPSSAMWPSNNTYWNYHCGADFGEFGNLKHFTPPLNARYGTANTAPDYLRKSMASIYEGHRAMFEGYTRNKYKSTGVIQWMLNNAWPSNIWHLFDYYWSPNPGSYYGSKKACEMIHIQYSYDDNTIWVVNSWYTATPSTYHAIIILKNYTGTTVGTYQVNVSTIDGDQGRSIFTLPNVTTTTTYFLRLQLFDNVGNTLVSHNDYWLSTIKDVAVWRLSTWYNTPYTTYADYTQLQSLPKVNIITEVITKEIEEKRYSTNVTLTNPSSTDIAFLIHARLLKKNTVPSNLHPADITLIFWDDNYITLFPLETRVLHAVYDISAAGGLEPDLVVEVFNNIA